MDHGTCFPLFKHTRYQVHTVAMHYIIVYGAILNLQQWMGNIEDFQYSLTYNPPFVNANTLNSGFPRRIQNGTSKRRNYGKLSMLNYVKALYRPC